MSRGRDLLSALGHAQVGGFFSTPPGLDGEPGLGIAGIHGVPRGRMWEAVASAHAPDLPGDATTFVVLEDGTVVVDDDLPDGASSLLPKRSSGPSSGRTAPPRFARSTTSGRSSPSA